MTTITIYAASTSIVISLGLLFYIFAPRQKPNLLTNRPISPFRQRKLSVSPLERVLMPPFLTLARYIKKLTPGGFTESTAEKLILSGFVAKISIEVLLGIKLVSGILIGLLVFLFAPFNPFLTKLALSIFSAFVGFLLPDIRISRAADARQKAIRSDLPEVMDQLTVIVESGLGFDSALRKVVQSSEGPLVEEFARVLYAIRLGQTRHDALGQVVDRTDVEELKQFISAIRQADHLGIPIARILRTQSEQMRELQRLAAEEAAMRLPVKLIFPMVFCMLPALFIVLIGPVIIRVAQNGLG